MCRSKTMGFRLLQEYLLFGIMFPFVNERAKPNAFLMKMYLKRMNLEKNATLVHWQKTRVISIFKSVVTIRTRSIFDHLILRLKTDLMLKLLHFFPFDYANVSDILPNTISCMYEHFRYFQLGANKTNNAFLLSHECAISLIKSIAA